MGNWKHELLFGKIQFTYILLAKVIEDTVIFVIFNRERNKRFFFLLIQKKKSFKHEKNMKSARYLLDKLTIFVEKLVKECIRKKHGKSQGNCLSSLQNL